MMAVEHWRMDEVHKPSILTFEDFVVILCVPYNCVSSYASTVRWKKNSFSAKKVINSLKNVSHCCERERQLGAEDGSLTCTWLSFKREIAI